ncbi:MAG TPA: M42 family peptidase, partial [Candidatus Eisenbacteria bacterium]|nr:M42 family peptidase [Candidatus Eisenbacteria bacterium]
MPRSKLSASRRNGQLEWSTDEWLRHLSALPGVAGYEHVSAPFIERAFGLFADRVERDRLGNVLGWIDGTGPAPRPRALLAAHMDRIGFLVSRVEAGGYLRVVPVGGFDPRTLPGKEVVIHSKPPMNAIFGTKPPHLQKKGEAEKVIPLEDLYLDTGQPEAIVKRRVPPGTLVMLRQAPVGLLKSRLAAPGMDDRSGIAVLIRTLQALRERRPAWDVIAVGTLEEEDGQICLGARTSAEGLRPEIGIAIDVSHGDMPGTREGDTVPLGGGPSLCMGANIHPGVFDGLRSTARTLGLPFSVEVTPASSGTDAMDI